MRPLRMVKRSALIGLLLLLGCSFGSGSAQDASIDHARALLLHGDYKEAIAAFGSLLDKNANDKEARTGLLQALLATGDYSGAESKARSYLTAKKEDASLQNVLGEVLLLTGKYQESATQFEHAAASASSARPGSSS